MTNTNRSTENLHTWPEGSQAAVKLSSCLECHRFLKDGACEMMLFTRSHSSIVARDVEEYSGALLLICVYPGQKLNNKEGSEQMNQNPSNFTTREFNLHKLNLNKQEEG